MAERFSGKVVLIAGGAGALGRAVSLAFLDELARVAVTYRSEKEFAGLKDAASSRAPSLEGHEVDATDGAAVRGLVAKIPSERGRLDHYRGNGVCLVEKVRYLSPTHLHSGIGAELDYGAPRNEPQQPDGHPNGHESQENRTPRV